MACNMNNGMNCNLGRNMNGMNCNSGKNMNSIHTIHVSAWITVHAVVHISSHLKIPFLLSFTLIMYAYYGVFVKNIHVGFC